MTDEARTYRVVAEIRMEGGDRTHDQEILVETLKAAFGGPSFVTVTEVPGAAADRGRDSGEALTSVRTVLSRAETALEELGPEGTRREWPTKTGDPAQDNYPLRKAGKFEDPDASAMRAALCAVVDLLGPWRKTGRTKRSTCL